MAYSNFTLAKVYHQFQLKEKRERLFPDVEQVTLSDWLKQSLAIAARSVMLTEKAKSERIVSPILFEFKERHANLFEIYSGYNLKEDNIVPVIYGCVTTGEEWQFLTLQDQLVAIDTKRYYLNQPGELLAIFDWIIGQVGGFRERLIA